MHTFEKISSDATRINLRAFQDFLHFISREGRIFPHSAFFLLQSYDLAFHNTDVLTRINACLLFSHELIPEKDRKEDTTVEVAEIEMNADLGERRRSVRAKRDKVSSFTVHIYPSLPLFSAGDPGNFNRLNPVLFSFYRIKFISIFNFLLQGCESVNYQASEGPGSNLKFMRL